MAVNALTARAEVPVEFEASYSEAVVSFNLKEYQKALEQLNALLVKSAKQIEFLELKALVLKGAKDEKGALNTYSELISAKLESKAPRKELAPYYFEAGVLTFRKNRLKEARLDFEESVRSGFNTIAAKFFLGNIAFKESRWDDANQYFAAVAAAKNPELSPAASFYQGRTALKQGDSSGAYEAFSAAKASAQEIISSSKETPELQASAKEILDNAIQALGPYDRSSFFGGVTLLAGYDSNVLAVPSSQTSIQTTGQDSVMTIFQGGVGYMSSPARDFQFVPSYRTSLNYNFNQDTRLGDFFTHTASLYVTRKPLARTSFGLKLEGTLTFQNQLDSTTDKSKFEPYSLQGSLGPYFKTVLAPGWLTGADLVFIPHREYGDPDTSEEYRRSGQEENLRAWIRRDSTARFWNPSFALVFDHNNTSGTEFRSTGLGFEFNDPLKLNERMDITPTASFTYTSYPDRTLGARKDKLFTLGANAVYRWTSHIAFLANVQYYNNLSNVEDTYQYNRYTISSGASYNF